MDPSRNVRFGDAHREAFRHLWRVFEAHSESVDRHVLEWLEGRAEFGPLLKQERTNGLHHAGETVRLASNGDWVRLGESLRRRGAFLADCEIDFHASGEWARAFRRPLQRFVVETYASEPDRLCAVLQALDDLADHCAALVSDAYLERRDASVRAREDDLATTLDSIGDGVIVTDGEGRVTRMNPVAERLTGFGRGECMGRPLETIFRIEHEQSGEAVESPVRRVLREGIVVGLANHTVLIAKDGTKKPIADSGAPVRRGNGDICGVVLVFRDVTEEREAEEKLRHWERIFQHATWGVGVVSAANLTFESVNSAYAEMHGYTPEELIGEPVSKLWAPETRADMTRHADETREHARLVVETAHVRRDGSQFPVEVVGTVIKDARGNPAHFIANVQDITERRKLQQSQLRAIELEAENRRIEEANRLKSEFLANMSHELRTPLNSIIGFTELLHDEQAGTIAPRQKEFLLEILAGGRHLLRLINDVLDLAKVEAGKMDFLPEPVDLSLLVRTVTQNLAKTALSKKLHVDVAVDESLADICLDPGRFTQLLYNYVSNALKFTPEGGRVMIRAFAEGPTHFRLEVEDTGPGVAPEDVARLFVPFQQLDSGATKRHGGTGLGLALTKRLAEAQGGSVGMRPRDGGGSIFFAVLPRGTGATKGATWRADEPAATSVLVVEDDPNDRRVLTSVLAKAGYVVTAVSTTSEAILAWQQRRFDAVTFSVTVPDGGDLAALLESIRGHGERKTVPVFAMTVVTDRDAAAGFAVTDVLAKPLDASALLAALERAGVPPVRGTPILVVDDDSGSLKLMEATLAKLGYDALCFSNAAEALSALERVRPAAIVLDLLMPSMDGFVFLQRLRGVPENARIPVMIWTVKDLSPDERRHLHDAAQAVVQKGAGEESPLTSALREFLPLGAMVDAEEQASPGEGEP